MLLKIRTKTNTCTRLFALYWIGKGSIGLSGSLKYQETETTVRCGLLLRM